MAWGLGVDGRPAEGLQSPHRAPYEGVAMHGIAAVATGVARDCGDVGSVAGSAREWNGLQPGQGATELGFQGQRSKSARRAGDPSHQSEDPPPEGRTAVVQPRPITWTAPGPLAASAPTACGSARRREVAYGVLDLGTGGDDRPPVPRLPIEVMKA